jgi:hypothetical protein
MMFNTRHQVVPISSPEELANALIEVVDGKSHARSLCLCDGFYYAGYLWLNDSRVPDAIHFHQEWGVIKSGQILIQGTARQIESITVSVLSRDELIELIKAVTAGEYDSDGWDTTVHTESPATHTCDHCR